jgi:hypothetical protein
MGKKKRRRKKGNFGKVCILCGILVAGAQGDACRMGRVRRDITGVTRSKARR